MNTQCNRCIFFDTCPALLYRCDDFYPSNQQDDGMLERVIEDGRSEFYKEWIPYVLDYDDDYFF